MFKPEEISKIKAAFIDLKTPVNISFPYIDEQLNEIRKTNDNKFETFSTDNDFSYHYNAVIGWEGQSYQYGYKEGFFKIAHMAIVPSAHQSDIMVYPIIFNYRHYLELVLKENLFRFQILFRLPISNKVDHKLDTLLEELIGILESRNLGFLISSKQKKVIQDFHNIDSKNDAFRYVYDIEGNLNHQYEHKMFNLLSLHYTMNEIYNDFNAIDYLFEYGSFFDDKYLNPEYEGLIVALNSFFTKKTNRKGINSPKKLLSIVLRFEHEFSNGEIFKFVENTFAQVSETEFEAGNKEFSLTIIIYVIDQKINAIRIK
ncbi:hypothetical protein [Bacillus halotolerans]|uniref:Uncharacterized protein n=1 Tax=Bacillus halotolerans TaxID=260554 RepID=A0A9Q6A8V8_9BACI|nr:hypothetical protein [Bacillus halotolerans]PLS07615.1 hypothetical protein CUU63_09965 [Bacillus halotolerans]